VPPVQSDQRLGPRLSPAGASGSIVSHRLLDLSQLGDYSTPKRRVKHGTGTGMTAALQCPCCLVFAI
jgi:hypothetical protein